MFLFNRDLREELVVVAEIGINHSGSINWIEDMLPILRDTGVSAVKLQLFTPELYVSRSSTSRFKFLESVCLSKSSFVKLVEMGEKLGIPVFATPLSNDLVNFVAETCGVIKIASGDFTFEPTINAALSSDAKVIASTGATSPLDISNFMRVANSARSNLSESVFLLHCVSAYPPPLSQTNLRAIPYLKEVTGLTIGFSSHFLEDAPIYAALAFGSRIFEVHVTDNRDRTDIRDHRLSRTPKELANIVKTLGELDKSFVHKTKCIQPAELEILHTLKKGLVYSRDLRAGHLLSESDINFARPLNPEVLTVNSVVGRLLRRDVSSHHSVNLTDLA